MNGRRPPHSNRLLQQRRAAQIASNAEKYRRYCSSSAFEKANFAHFSKSPVQMKARAVIRKYRMHIRQMEFKRLQMLVPSVQNMQQEPSEVQILNEAVAYIDQLHHKLLDQIHSVGLPPQLIKAGLKKNNSSTSSCCSSNSFSISQRKSHPAENMGMNELKSLLAQVMSQRLLIKK